MSDKTYSEQCGIPAFDWHLALDNPAIYEDGELAMKAEEWTTCAVGNQCAIIPRNPRTTDDWRDIKDAPNRPCDDQLANLGIDFYDQVDDGRWDAAKETLAKIEARSAILIAEELQKRNASYVESASQLSE